MAAVGPPNFPEDFRVQDSLENLIGNTPIIRLGDKTAQEYGVLTNIFLKLESLEPCSSVKDRMAKALIEGAEQRGEISPGQTILVEPTSGNTGIGLAMIGAAKGYSLILVMPASMSIERRVMLKALGSNLVLTPPEKGMAGAVAKAKEIARKLAPNSFILDQFNNLDNVRCHRETTGPEIWHQMKGSIDILVAGVGTGGTISGISQYIKPLKPSLHVVAVEPAESPVLSGGKPGPHKIQGIGTGFIPGNFFREFVDEVLPIHSDEAINTARKLATSEGVFVGISSGAALAAALMVGARPENAGKNIVVIMPSFGERYLSSVMFKSLQEEAIYQMVEPLEEETPTFTASTTLSSIPDKKREDPYPGETTMQMMLLKSKSVAYLTRAAAKSKPADDNTITELSAVHRRICEEEKNLHPDAVRILRYWFKLTLSDCLKLWFGKDEATDKFIEAKFKPLVLKARNGELSAWIKNPLACLALIISLDQFPRNIFRFSPEMYSCDEMALSVVMRAIFYNYHTQATRIETVFFCLVLTHSENINHQELCMEIWSAVSNDLPAGHALKKFDDIFRKHVSVISQFGRFPHRNKILRRGNTVEEAKFLEDLNFRFDLPLKPDASGFQTNAKFEDRGGEDRYDWDYGL